MLTKATRQAVYHVYVQLLVNFMSLHNDNKISRQSTGRKRWKTNDEKMVDFWCRLFHALRRVFMAYKGRKRWKKNISLFDDLFHG